jgi:hypothetical protein
MINALPARERPHSNHIATQMPKGYNHALNQLIAKKPAEVHEVDPA